MPTTATPPTSQPEVTPELWRAYRRLRALHKVERPSRAAGLALTECGFTKGDTRERLSRALTEREEKTGLRPTAGEAREDAALEAALAEAEQPEPDSLQAVRADAARTIAELEQARARLAPEAVAGDHDVLAELASIDGQLAQARSTAQLADLAELETARREREQAEQAEREHRENASREAAKLEPVIAKLGADVDAKAAAWVAAVVALRDATEQRASYVAGAEPGDQMRLRGARFRGDSVVGALRAALRGHVRLDGLEPGRGDSLLAASEHTEGE